MIPDATYEVTKILPSVLLTSADDRRIDNLAEEKKDFFLVTIQNKDENLVAIINPASSEGILWWKKPSRLILTSERWLQIIKSESQLTDSELKFFSKSEI